MLYVLNLVLNNLFHVLRQGHPALQRYRSVDVAPVALRLPFIFCQLVPVHAHVKHRQQFAHQCGTRLDGSMAHYYASGVGSFLRAGARTGRGLGCVRLELLAKAGGKHSAQR